MNHCAPCPTFKLQYAQLSDLGMRRSNNQDAVAVVVTDDVATWSEHGHLLMVADGMGAHAAGELASKLAVDNIPHTYFKLRELYPPMALRQAIRDANALINAKGLSSVGFQGMGTTCSCLVLLPQGALVAHIGDSRVYRFRGRQLEQLTFDPTTGLYTTYDYRGQRSLYRDSARIAELAEMLGALGDTGRQSAAELLAQARERKGALKGA